MRRKLRPIQKLSKRRAEKRRLARKLGFRDEYQFERWIDKHRNLPESDIRHLRKGIADDDFIQLNRIRQISKRYKTPAQRLIEKKKILVDTAGVKQHMSAFAFQDRYIEQLLALLKDPGTTEYRRRQLRKIKRDLDAAINAGDIGRPRQLDLFGQYHGEV